jgi:hypothetical protein
VVPPAHFRLAVARFRLAAVKLVLRARFRLAVVNPPARFPLPFAGLLVLVETEPI